MARRTFVVAGREEQRAAAELLFPADLYLVVVTGQLAAVAGEAFAGCVLLHGWKGEDNGVKAWQWWIRELEPHLPRGELRINVVL